MQWKSQEANTSSRPKKMKLVCGATKSMLIGFCYSRHCVPVILSMQSSTVTLLRRLREDIRRKWSERNGNWMLHYDNVLASADSALTTREFFFSPTWLSLPSHLLAGFGSLRLLRLLQGEVQAGGSPFGHRGRDPARIVEGVWDAYRTELSRSVLSMAQGAGIAVLLH